MPSALPTTIPEDEVPPSYEFSSQVTFKLIKVYASDDENDSKSHTQLFYNVTNKTDLSKCTPSYCRGVYQPNKKINNLYWYNEALKSVSPSSTESAISTLWTIDQVKVKQSKVFKKTKRPRTFSINSTELECRSVFEYGSSKSEPKGYSGEVTTPFDNSSIQRYRWVRYKDGSRWVFIARNDPNTPLVELRKTSSENEFDIVFLELSPPGWRKNDNSTYFFNQSSQFTGRYPSVFSNPSTYRSSATSRFLSNRDSSFSDISNTSNDRYSRNSSVSHVKNSKTFSSYLKNLAKNDSEESEDSESNIKDSDSERYWQEYVLASTVTIQDEVNSNKSRLWKKRD